MSDKPSPKPTAANAPAKSAGNGATSTAKGSTGSTKSKLETKKEETFEFLEPAQKPDEIGRLAHFRVLKVVGRGGMSFVFMAEDTRLKRIVALKVMLPTIARKAIARERFIREARATAQIEHDHIITIYEVEGEGDVPYAAMQFLKGMSLEDWLKAGKTLKVPQLLRIGKEIAKGLSAAHSNGLIHRDIKPSNIWLDSTNKGRVKILDFGLARPLAENTNLTQLGMILGTPAYMSPEQARGEVVDGRCDLFSLGCVLYRLCSGKLPFTGQDAMSMLLAITNEEPAPLQPLNADVPVELKELIHKLLAKKREDRPASAREVVIAFQAIERQWIATASTVVHPITPIAAPVSPDHELTAAEEIDAVLEESAITEQEFLGVTNPGATGPRSVASNRRWLFAGMGCAGLIVMSLICCVGSFVATNYGSVEIIAEDDDAKAKLESMNLVAIDHQKTPHTLKVGVNRLRPGGYAFDMKNVPSGLKIDKPAFAFLRGEPPVIVKIRYATPGPVTPKRSEKPDIILMTSDQARKLQRDWAAYLRVDVRDTSSKAGPTLVLIPPGEFQMGSTDDQLRQHLKDFPKKLDLRPDLKKMDAEKPAHLVRIPRPFYMSATEVTYGQFSKFAFGAEYTTEAEKKGGGTGLEPGKEPTRKPDYTWKNTGIPGSNDHPVCNITWKDADAYCKWLGKADGKTYRLPTEAEWEYACRAGNTTLWSFGDSVAKDSKSFEYMWLTFPTKLPRLPLASHRVEGKKNNDFGLYDMHGNIAEMCSDWYDAAYYEACAADKLTLDPKGPGSSPAGERVVRGGSFLTTPAFARSGYRDSVDPALGWVQVGFRIVCEIPD